MDETIDSVETIPFSVIEKLAERTNSRRRYSLRRAAEIINRSMGGEYEELDSTEIRKGHLIKNDKTKIAESFHQQAIIGNDSGVTSEPAVTVSREEMSVEVRGMTFPGLAHGEAVFDTLTKKYEQLIQDGDYTEEEILRIAALGMVVTGTSHAFPDASGRTAVGLADFIIRTNSNRKINLQKLRSKNQQLLRTLTYASYAALPEQYNPSIILEEMQQSDQKHRLIRIPTPQNSSTEEILGFKKDFANSLINKINNFDPENLNLSDNFDIQIDSLAALVDSCLE